MPVGMAIARRLRPTVERFPEVQGDHTVSALEVTELVAELRGPAVEVGPLS